MSYQKIFGPDGDNSWIRATLRPTTARDIEEVRAAKERAAAEKAARVAHIRATRQRVRGTNEAILPQG